MSGYRPPRIPRVSTISYIVYRTKDFRAEPFTDGGFRIVGSHPQSRGWLDTNAGNGFRKQFMDEAGYLRAEDADEVKALITQLQAEHG